MPPSECRADWLARRTPVRSRSSGGISNLISYLLDKKMKRNINILRTQMKSFSNREFGLLYLLRIKKSCLFTFYWENKFLIGQLACLIYISSGQPLTFEVNPTGLCHVITVYGLIKSIIGRNTICLFFWRPIIYMTERLSIFVWRGCVSGLKFFQFIW